MLADAAEEVVDTSALLQLRGATITAPVERSDC